MADQTVYEAARLTGLQPGTIKKYCRDGRIRGIKKRIFHQVTPLTGIERHFPTGLLVWMVPERERASLTPPWRGF
jgi:hypothetical protein